MRELIDGCNLGMWWMLHWQLRGSKRVIQMMLLPERLPIALVVVFLVALSKKNSIKSASKLDALELVLLPSEHFLLEAGGSSDEEAMHDSTRPVTIGI